MRSTAPRPTNDIAVGYVTPPNEDPTGVLVKVATGLQTYFPHYSSFLLNNIGGQAAGLTWRGDPSRASSYRHLLTAAQRRKASVCLIVNPDEQGFESSWVDALVRPGIHSQHDLVTPVYSTSAREQPLSRNLLSPMLGALFGRTPAQPMPGEFLWLARAGSFLMKTQWKENAEVEAELKRLNGFFVALQPELERRRKIQPAQIPKQASALLPRQRAA